MSRYKVYPEITSVYFCTCTIVGWQVVFKEEKYFQIIIDSLKYCQANKGLILYGYVIMLNHLHLIVSYKENTMLPDIMRDFKRHTSKHIADSLIKDNEKLLLYVFRKAAERHRKKIRYKIWRDAYHPKAVFSEKFFNQKLRYIHTNPVKKGFVSRAEDWKYSSARNWILNDHSVISLDLDLF